jgi:hypothetical protein
MVKSENVWQAHLGSTQHRDNIAKLKALKEEQQQRKRTAPPSEQPASKRAKPSLTQYNDDDSADMEDDKEEKQQEEQEEEDDEDNALPADFFDKNEDDMEEVEEEEEEEEGEEEPQEESNTLPTGFFDDPEEDARVHGTIAPAEQAELDLEQGMEEFKDAMVDVTKEVEEIQEEDDELFWQERNEDIFREQVELDSRVEKLKQMRQTGHVEALDKQRQVDDDISTGLKQSVRQVLKSTSVKKVTTMFDDMDEDSSSEEEEEDDDWRAQQLS